MLAELFVDETNISTCILCMQIREMLFTFHTDYSRIFPNLKENKLKKIFPNVKFIQLDLTWISVEYKHDP